MVVPLLFEGGVHVAIMIARLRPERRMGRIKIFDVTGCDRALGGMPTAFHERKRRPISERMESCVKILDNAVVVRVPCYTRKKFA